MDLDSLAENVSKVGRQILISLLLIHFPSEYNLLVVTKRQKSNLTKISCSAYGKWNTIRLPFQASHKELLQYKHLDEETVMQRIAKMGGGILTSAESEHVNMVTQTIMCH
jgi:hypothetical protein